MAPNKITSAYIHELQCAYFNISDRGIRVDRDKLKINREIINQQINDNLEIASKQWGCKVFIGKENDPGKSDKNAVNLNATQGERALLQKLKDIGYHVPKITKKNEEGDYESKYSTGELALQKMLAENQFNHPSGDPAIRAILKVRELGKLKSGYFAARLLRRNIQGEDNFFFLSTYNAAGTITGRRASKRHTFHFGNNGQNFPSHSKSAKLFTECLIPRVGNIFLFVDQIQAEEWPVSALSMNFNALKELETQKDPDPEKRIDRHSKLATAVFGEFIPPKASKLWEDKYDMKRYLGKKIKHARNYGMKKKRMSESLAQEGFSVSEATCEILLSKAAQVDPTVDTIFHKYIHDTITEEHMLKTPFGRERLFIGARPNADNSTLFNEAYAWIPQSTVGDNTGFAVYDLENLLPEAKRYIVQEGHDSIVQDIPANAATIAEYLERTVNAFDRVIRFHNGIEINIPIEAELGFNFKEKIKLERFDIKSIEEVINKLESKRAKQEVVAA